MWVFPAPSPRICRGVEGVVARRDGHRHARRAGQPVAFALDEGGEGEVRVQLRVDYDALESRNHERILYICGVRLRVEARDGRRVGLRRHGNRLRGARHGVVEPRLLPVELRDDRPEERDVVLLDLAHVAFVGNAQAERRAVELERNDGLEPLLELFGRGLRLDPIEAVLPHIAVCLRVIQHDG